MDSTIIDTDVLVIGGGGAGFRAAIEARAQGVKVVLASKGPLARSGASPMAGADFTLDGKSLHELGFPGDPNDSYEKFFSDIVTQGFYLNNQKMIDQYIRGAKSGLKDLLDWGLKVIFSEQRAIFTSGTGIMDAMLKRAREVGVQLLEDVMVIDLLTKDGKVVGALALEIGSGKLIRFRTKAVVVASGGWHKAYFPTTGMRDLSGEGIAMAHRAGADIGNMEFITFACNIPLSPPLWRGSIVTYIIFTLCGGELTNSQGEAFLKKYDPYVVETACFMEWNKSILSWASAREVRDGKGSPNGGVYLGIGDQSWEEYELKALQFFGSWKYKAMDLSEMARTLREGRLIEVGPAVEYFDGGITVNERFETPVEGLFAAGECTMGMFGANRICSAITEMVVQGTDAGRHAGEYAKKEISSPEPDAETFAAMEDQAIRPLERGEGIRPAPLRKEIQVMAHKHLGPIRTAESLKDFMRFLETVQSEKLPDLAAGSSGRSYNKEWVEALELPNMVHLLQMAAKSALFRTESRGVHYREDYPTTNNEDWCWESRVTKQGDSYDIRKEPLTVTSATPLKDSLPYLEMVRKMMEAHSEIGGHH